MDGPQSSSSSKRIELVIVALPSDEDYVRKISSEKEPHLTLLYLGEGDYTPSQVDHMAGYVQHASSQFFEFGLQVEDRGELGEDHADVLFFHTRPESHISRFREHLLQNDLIKQAYLSTEQFPEWLPHLTLGYPDIPAKKDDRDFGISWVDFDKIALWTSDSAGPTTKLKSFMFGTEVSMSHVGSGQLVVSNILDHSGVKGMKWGVRKSDSETSSSTKIPRASTDAKKADASREKANVGSVKALSTKELQNLTKRMELEQKYNNMLDKEPSKIDRGHNAVKKTLTLARTAQDVYNIVNSPAGKALRKAVIGV